MKTSNISLLTSLLLLLLAGCGAESLVKGVSHNTQEQPEAIISAIKNSFAPDKRVALFDVEAVKIGNSVVLRGETNLPEAADSLRSALEEKGISYLDSIQILPEAELLGKTFGIINVSVANLRSDPKHAAELATQATLGTPLRVLKRSAGWYLVQTPDHYLSWVDYGGLVSMSKEAFDAWHAAEKLIYLKPFGFSYEKTDTNASTISDLVGGSILELSGRDGNFYKVKYPDGRTAYIKQDEAQLYTEWIAALNPSSSSLVATSHTLMGLPYLWGGTSFKGVDCSGFTKTVYFLNGMVIPRDASQQVHTGLLIDSVRGFERLLPGDLLFFGRPATDTSAEKVVHVGMWLGNNQFIHASGMVQINSMDSTAENFDRYNYNRYLRTKRLLQQSDDKIIRLRSYNLFQ